MFVLKMLLDYVTKYQVIKKYQQPYANIFYDIISNNLHTLLESFTDEQKMLVFQWEYLY